MAHTAKKLLLSGVKPTGRPHIGNYFGAMRQFVNLQNDYESYFMIADLHALTSVHDKKTMEENILGVALDYLAIGLDPQKAVIFKQSDVPEHAEMAWIFNCITTMPYLMRAHAFKDAEARDKDINVGVFTYPLLMASDILLYDVDVVPVGKDQQQHLEIARDTAEKFNRTFGETFRLPTPHIVEDVAVVPGTDGQKMSKSYNNTIGLFASYDEIQKAVMSIPTDSLPLDAPRDPEEDDVFALHRLLSDNAEEIAGRYRDGTIGHKESKERLIENIEAFIAPLRQRREQLSANIDDVKAMLKDGGERARTKASAKMREVKEKTGFTLY